MPLASKRYILALVLFPASWWCSTAWTLDARKPTPSEISRRDLGWTTAATLAALTVPQARAAEEGVARDEGLLSTNNVADILHVVPTFTIVDPKGVPYMVVGEDAKVTGYFFATFEEADRILKLARTSADKSIRDAKKAGQEVDVNPWTKARISTVPLDFAVTLVAKSIYTKNYFQVAPAEEDVEDALELTGKNDLAEGKVPLFYMEDFKIDTEAGAAQSPLYFRKSELIEAYKKQNKGKEMPPILVTELFAVLLEMVKPGGTDEDLKNLALVPPKGSSQKAKQCEKAGGKEPPFVLGKRNLVL